MIVLTLLVLADAMESAQAQGKALGQWGAKQARAQIEHVSAADIAPPDGEGFDANAARTAVKTGTQEGKTPALDYLRSAAVQNNKTPLDAEYMLARAETIAQEAQKDSIQVEDAQEYTLVTCQQTDAPYPVSVIRSLRVEVAHDPGETKMVKICGSHEERETYSTHKAALKAKKRWEERLASDPTIRTCHVECYEKHRWRVKPHWTHYEDAATCTYQTVQEKIRPPSWEEVGDMWEYENSNVLASIQHPDCTLIFSECLDTTSKNIKGKEVHRPCWRERLTFCCSSPQSNNTLAKNPNCEFLHKRCLQEGSYGCQLWEVTYKCYTKLGKKSLKIEPMYQVEEEHTYAPNTSFSEVATKLTVFAEIKKELENTGALDAQRVQLFKGKKMQCSKSIADKLLYDCCFNHAGLAQELGLKTCNAEELALAEMRKNGLCYYVGAHKEEFLDLWKSCDAHAFCCFGSKLAKILQENARHQLNIGWGDPKHVDCRGLSLDEISHLDFTTMDFSALCEGQQVPESLQSKLEEFGNRIKEKAPADG